MEAEEHIKVKEEPLVSQEQQQESPPSGVYTTPDPTPSIFSYPHVPPSSACAVAYPLSNGSEAVQHDLLTDCKTDLCVEDVMDMLFKPNNETESECLLPGNKFTAGYVEKLEKELAESKRVQEAYRQRIQALMNLVEKQSTKIAELRSIIASNIGATSRSSSVNSFNQNP